MLNYKYRNHRLFFLLLAAIILAFSTASNSAADDDNEDTYSINLVQTAEVAKETVELDNKKVLTETYIAKKGDYIWKILRKKNVLEKNNLGDVLAALKKLNRSLSNIDMIHPGEKIVIPLIITPITNRKKPENVTEVETAPLESVKNLEYYTVRPGDSLIRVINKKYSIPGNELYNEYLDKLRKLNPDLKDLNNIYPGQKVRLPIYSPRIARGIIKEKPEKPEEPEQDNEALKLANKEKGERLSRIFTMIGEEWIQQGKHFIPLKAGGQIDLNTETYPIINLRNGDKVIVDLYDNLPEKMSALITADWDNYHIVHITGNDDLMTAVGKIISACGYYKVYRRNESLVFEDGFKIELTADWIIQRLPEVSNNDENIICLNLTGKDAVPFPSTLKNFLLSHGVKIIDYPEPLTKEDIPSNSNIVSLSESRDDLIKKVLELTGQNYSSRLDIPIFKGENSDFNLVIKADYFFNRDGKDCIIDLSGFGDDIINLLKEHHFSVLSLAGEQDPPRLVAKILDFMGIEFSDREHTFDALPGGNRGNVKLVIPGILFTDSKGKSDFFSQVNLNPDISGFLSTKVDNIFLFSGTSEAGQHGRQDTRN